MTFQSVLGVALLTTSVSACAIAPENIAPNYVSPMTFEHWTCEQMLEEDQRLTAALASAYQAQHNARTGDTMGVILLGLPVSSLSGNNMAAEVGRLKGEQQTLQQTLIRKNCDTSQMTEPAPTLDPSEVPTGRASPGAWTARPGAR